MFQPLRENDSSFLLFWSLSRKGVVMRVVSLSFILVLVVGICYGQVTIVGSGEKVELEDLVDSPTKVTVVLKNQGAIVPNVVIAGISENHFSISVPMPLQSRRYR